MQTPLKIVFNHTESSDLAEAMIRERVARLERFHPKITACRVVVDVPHRTQGSGKNALSVKIEVEVPGRTLVAEDVEEMRDVKGDRASVFHRAFEAMQRQLQDDSHIREGHVKLHESAGDTGRVVRMFPEGEYGFVEMRGSPDLHFTRSAVVDGEFDALKVGMLVRVTRAPGEGPMGPQASSVQRLGGEGSI